MTDPGRIMSDETNQTVFFVPSDLCGAFGSWLGAVLLGSSFKKGLLLFRARRPTRCRRKRSTGEARRTGNNQRATILRATPINGIDQTCAEATETTAGDAPRGRGATGRTAIPKTRAPLARIKQDRGPGLAVGAETDGGCGFRDIAGGVRSGSGQPGARTRLQGAIKQTCAALALRVSRASSASPLRPSV